MNPAIWLAPWAAGATSPASGRFQKDLEEIRASQQLLMETASDFAVFRLRAIRVRPRGLNVIFVSPSAKDIAGITEPMKPERWFQVHADDRKAMRYAYVKDFKR
jgi:hypothetical protein